VNTGGRAPLAILSAIYAIYAAAWSYISIMRFLSLNAFILDLGVNIQFAWDALLRSSLPSFLQDFAHKGIVYLVAPVFLTGSYPAVLIFQSAFIGLGAFPIYGIARRALGSDAASLAMAASYLIYFPLAGVNWYDFHYQALFPTLFLLGYCFYLSGRRIPSHISAVLSQEYLAATSEEGLHNFSGSLRILSAASARALASPSLTLIPFLPSSTVSETPGTS
jgi:uncharacterized membrane protein